MSASRHDYSKAQRLGELRELLAQRPRRVGELAAHFGVSKRSVQRDLADLRGMGLALEADSSGVYRLPSAPSALNAPEALAVHTAARMLYHAAPSADPFLRSGLRKLAALLPAPAREAAHRDAEELPGRGLDGRVFELVARGWLERRVLAVEYRPAQGTRWRRRELEVLFVEASPSNLDLYALATDRLKGEAVLAWKLARMRNPRLLEAQFTPPEGFDPREHLEGAWGIAGGGRVRAVLRFAPEAARRAREGLPNLERLEGQPDGSLLAEFRVGADAEGFPFEFLPWVLSWGSRVEVLEPEELRERWIAEVRDTLEGIRAGQQTGGKGFE